MTFSSMLRALAGYVGARFLGAGLGLLTQLVVARTLPPADVAVVLLAMSAAAFFSLLMNGGEVQMASTYLPRLMTLAQTRTLRAFHGFALRQAVLRYALILGGLVVFAVFAPERTELLIAALAGWVAAPFSALARYNAMIANSLRRFPLSYVPDFVVRPGLFLAAMALLVPLGLHGNSHAILFAFVAGVWAVGLGQAWLMGPDRLRLRDFELSRRRFSRLLLPRTLSLLVVSITSFAFADIVMLLAGLLLRPDDAAVAGVAIRLAAIAGFILQAAQLFVLPDFTEAMTRRDMVQVNAVLWRMNALTLAVVLAGLVGAVLLGRFALSFFGPFYADGAGLLMLFMVGQSIRALGGMNQNLLAVAGHQIRTARACALALLVLGAVSSLLCARFGPIGLGYGVVAAELTWLLALAAQAQSLCGRRADLLWLTRNA